MKASEKLQERFCSLLMITALIMIISGIQTASALCVKSNTANLRYGPSKKYQKTWEVYRYMPFKKLKSKHGWYRVKDVDGDIHWIYSSLTTSRFRCAVVKKKSAPLHSGPGVKYSKLKWGPAQKYYAFKVIGHKGRWYHLEDAAGGKAWIYKRFIWIQ